MNSEETTYEMPLETEDSFRSKIEAGKIKEEKEIVSDDNWIPDIYLDEVHEGV